ncbi:MAG: stage III sporulation protein AB [Clostridia bacterium]|nr:stage III sporulation protein AB [Clostridia bacterium]
MNIIKYIILFVILGISSYIGILLSKKYSNREKELKELKNAISILGTQIKFTYEPLPTLFKQIGEITKGNIGEIFTNAYIKMENNSAGDAWKNAVEESSGNLNKEDKEIIKRLGNLLGQVDVEGQLKEITLVNEFINGQIEKAEQERKKNERLYRVLGATIGMAIVIVLI